MHKLSVGIIGYRNHSAKIINLLDNIKAIKKIKVYIHKKNIDKNYKILSKKIFYTLKINDLNNVDAIFITSPPSLHFFYLKKFIKLNKYIFCEKPPVVNYYQLQFLNNLSYKNKRLIYFNFNLLYSNFFNIISKELINKKNGKLINIMITSTHGLSFMKNYKNNWRFSKNIISNISGNLGIHFIHILSYLIGLPKRVVFTTNSLCKKNSNDTSNINIVFKNNITSNIFLSYATVKDKIIRFYFTNSIIDICDSEIKIFSPRNTFNDKKLFITPPPKIILKQKSLEENSMNKSIIYFLNTIISNKKFSIKDFNLAVEVNKFYFPNKKNINK